MIWYAWMIALLHLADSGGVDERHALARVAHEHGIVHRLTSVLQRLQQRVPVGV